MIKQLEKEFFKFSFEEIKNHPLFEKINITDQEIIKNREKIKQSLNFYQNCSSKADFCNTLLTHYSIHRNENEEIIFIPYICKKSKCIANIEDEIIDKKIKKFLISEKFSFTSEEAKTSTKLLIEWINKKKLNDFKVLKDINNWSNLNKKTSNLYLNPDPKIKNDLSIFYAYYSIIRDEYVCIISAQNLKKIICKKNMNFQEIFEIEENYKNLIEITNLIVLNFGYEDEINQVSYLLDYLIDFFQNRNSNNKKTIIITEIEWDEIQNSIVKYPKFNFNNNIHKKKILLLNNFFQNMFF